MDAVGGSGEEERLVRECEQYLSSRELRTPLVATDPNPATTSSHSGSVPSPSEDGSGTDGRCVSSTSLPPDSAAVLERKRNLVDRCVHKVRSLIRK